MIGLPCNLPEASASKPKGTTETGMATHRCPMLPWCGCSCVLLYWLISGYCLLPERELVIWRSSSLQPKQYSKRTNNWEMAAGGTPSSLGKGLPILTRVPGQFLVLSPCVSSCLCSLKVAADFFLVQVSNNWNIFIFNCGYYIIKIFV